MSMIHKYLHLMNSCCPGCRLFISALYSFATLKDEITKLAPRWHGLLNTAAANIQCRLSVGNSGRRDESAA